MNASIAAGSGLCMNASALRRVATGVEAHEAATRSATRRGDVAVARGLFDVLRACRPSGTPGGPSGWSWTLPDAFFEGCADGCADGWARRLRLPGPAAWARVPWRTGRGCWLVQATVRNRSCAWRFDGLDEVAAVSPGISTTMMLPPWVVTSASVTPEPLTRWSMIPRGLVEVLRGGAALGVGDPRAALEVQAERGLPAAAERHQAVGDRHHHEEHHEGAPRPGGLACHVSSPPTADGAGLVLVCGRYVVGPLDLGGDLCRSAPRATLMVTPSAISTQTWSSSSRCTVPKTPTSA